MHRSRYAPLSLVLLTAVWALPATPASALLITRNVDHQITATPDGPNQTYELDVDLDGVADFTFRSLIGLPEDPAFASFADVAPPFGTVNGVVIDSFTGDGFPTASRLQPGAVVSAASLFSGNNDLGNLSSQFFPDPPTGNFQNQSGFVGFQFAGLGGTHYGFIQLMVNDLLASQNPLAVTLGTVSYESIAGQPAIVTAVPEPTTMAFAALALAVLVTGTRRRVAA